MRKRQEPGARERGRLVRALVAGYGERQLARVEKRERWAAANRERDLPVSPRKKRGAGK